MIKILLVEDDKIIVASVSEYLNSEGYLVRSVSGQAAAMKLLAEEKDIRNRYISVAEEISDPQLKEKLQKCAAVHGSHISVINGLTGEKND